MIKDIGAFAGLVAFLGLALLAMLSFSQARDLRRLREWAGSAPERDADRKETTSAAAAQRAEAMRKLDEAREAERRAADLREERRKRREAGLPEMSRTERVRELFAGRGRRLGEPRYLIAIFVVAVVVGGGVAYAVLHGFGDNQSGGAHGSASLSKPGDIEVAVLNGTAVPGLAARYGDKVERKGFSLGEVTNSAASYVDSVVMYRRGRAPEARRVGKALRISHVRLMTPDIASVSGGAPVSVVVGQDNATTSG